MTDNYRLVNTADMSVALLRMLQDRYKTTPEKTPTWDDAVISILTYMAGAKEVVRCKDCVHYCKYHVLGDSIEDDEYYMVCDIGLGAIDDDCRINDRVHPDDFCSMGVKKKE